MRLSERTPNAILHNLERVSEASPAQTASATPTVTQTQQLSPLVSERRGILAKGSASVKD